jgi:hypothetical protein
MVNSDVAVAAKEVQKMGSNGRVSGPFSRCGLPGV